MNRDRLAKPPTSNTEDKTPPELDAVRLDGPYRQELGHILPTAMFLVTVSGMLGYVLGVLSVIWWPR